MDKAGAAFPWDEWERLKNALIPPYFWQVMPTSQAVRSTWTAVYVVPKIFESGIKKETEPPFFISHADY